MIIVRMRLKNVKSFGEGPSGSGVTVELDRGLNRIGGPNGSGKSTIIEAIGYALFDAEPVRGDNRVRVDTYLLRSGCKTGEIDIWVEAEDCLYRVERDVGQALRRWKVAREGDDFIEAEGDGEVRDMLARLWGLPDPGRLGEVFHGLIGVKQGHFTRPFDCSPKAAREHFDPLLDVDIFRQCFDYLLDSVRALEKQKAELDVSLSGIEGRMQQLQDAPGRLKEAEEKEVEARQAFEESAARVKESGAALEVLETALKERVAAERSLAEARTLWQGAVARHEAARLAVEESRRAVVEIEAAKPGFLSYRAAEEEYRRLELERAGRDELRQAEAKLAAEDARLLQEQDGLAQAIQRSRTQAEEKKAEAERRAAALAERRSALAASMQELSQSEERHASAAGCLEKVRRWEQALSAAQGRLTADLDAARRLASELSGYDGGLVERARMRLQAAQERLTEAQAAYSAAEEGRKTLARQLESIAGGVCPFLGEPCRQFDAQMVQGQLERAGQRAEQCRAALAGARAEVSAAEAAWEAAQQTGRESAVKAGRLNTLLEGLTRLWGALEDAGARAAALSLGELWPAGELPDLPSAGCDAASWDSAASGLSALQSALKGASEGWRRQVDLMQNQCREQRARCERESGSVENEAHSIEALLAEAERLEKDAAGQEGQRKAGLQRRAEVGAKLAEARAGLAQYEGLDERMSWLREDLDRLRPEYNRYLQNEPLAGRLVEREAAQANADKELQERQAAVEQAENLQREAGARYNEEAHGRAREEFSAAQMAHGAAGTQLEGARAELAEQGERARAFAELSAKRQELLREADRYRAQAAVLEKGRTTLKAAQGIVAQGLTRHIQARGQSIFNAMSPEPAQFEWEPDDYRLTVHTASGPRRFTQLSGGQQMKVAIAMQLALVREFSSAGICAFDEPTYGLDAEGRSLLAEAIAQVQKECRFEQLLVVSHDEAFDDKVEHAVNLAYSPLRGTTVRE